MVVLHCGGWGDALEVGDLESAEGEHCLEERGVAEGEDGEGI